MEIVTKITGELALYDCDKYDYFVSAFSGLLSGIIDIVFVGAPGESVLGEFTDDKTNKIVIRIAKLCREKDDPEISNLKEAISFLEKKFPVTYDLQYSKEEDNGFGMAAVNHHIKSLAHSPDPKGWFFSILDQFNDTSTFVSDGKFITIRGTGNGKNLTYLDEYVGEFLGHTFVAKLIAGTLNWLGHLASDVAGSNNTQGRGSGLPLPFAWVTQLCNFGEFIVGKDKKTLCELMTRVFQEGYDLRFGMATAIPVLINEIFIRFFWVLKRHYYHELEWKKCWPKLENYSLHKMLLVGNAALCLADFIDAAVRSGGNALTFVLRLNFAAWIRLIHLIYKYLTLSRAKMEYERKHIENMQVIKAIEARTEELKLEIKQFLEEQQLIIDNNLKIATLAIVADDVDTTGAALNNIAQLFGAELQFTNFKEFDEFMLDPDTVFEL